MLFLLEYDRPTGKLVSLRTFARDSNPSAEEVRLDLELSLRARGVVHEVVILEAADEAAIRRTHRRYFVDLKEHAEGPTAVRERPPESE